MQTGKNEQPEPRHSMQHSMQVAVSGPLFRTIGPTCTPKTAAWTDHTKKRPIWRQKIARSVQPAHSGTQIGPIERNRSIKNAPRTEATRQTTTHGRQLTAAQQARPSAPHHPTPRISAGSAHQPVGMPSRLRAPTRQPPRFPRKHRDPAAGSTAGSSDA